MSIASEILRLQGVKTNIFKALSDMRVTVPAVPVLSDCPDLIRSIKTGGGGSGTISDGIDAKPIVPENKIWVVDENGYKGGYIDDFFVYRGSTYYYNFALVVYGVDYSSEGKGQVTFYEMVDNQIGGKVYRTVTIGGKGWLAENLDFKFSGCAIGQSGTSYSEPRANYYSNDETANGWTGRRCGLLYNWIAVKYLNDHRAELIPGWHVPSPQEWDALATAVGGTGVAGTKLKSKDASVPESSPNWPTGWNGTDEYGFSALPAGNYNGGFDVLGSNAYFWTSSEYGSGYAYRRYFNTGASMRSDRNYEDSQYSVRLVKDSQ